MSTNLYEAHRQWVVRPPDERFPSLEALNQFVQNRRQCSSEEVRSLKHVDITVTPDGVVAMNGNTPVAYFTNWSFSQLSASIGAPAKYLRSLPVEMVRDCLKYGLARTDQRCKLLIRETPSGNGDQSQNWTSAFTSSTYGRIWDADVIANLMEAVYGSAWHVPVAMDDNESVSSGLYASDRDMFVFLVNDERPVEVGNSKLGRGFFCWNSETGASSFGLTTFLYNYVCGNHIVWGAEQVKELRIVHRNRAIDRFYRDAIPILNQFVENRILNDRIENVVGQAMDSRIGTSLEDVLKWFRQKPFTKREIIQAWKTGLSEGDDVTTTWGMVQGLTAFARNIPHADQRVSLERRAGALLN